MVQSPSGRFSWLRVWLTGKFRSAHSLLITTLTACFGFFWLARDAYPIIAYGSFGLFAVCAGVVFLRYHRRGPEGEHGLPEMSWTGNQMQVINVDLDSESVERLARLAAETRQQLPPPAGLIEGSASDKKAIRMLTEKEAAKIAETDAEEISLPDNG